MTLIEALRLALSHHLAGRQAEAIAICDAIRRTHPDQQETLQLLAVAALSMGDQGRAERALKTVAALNPSAVDAYSNFGVLRQNQGRSLEGERLHGRAVTTDPAKVEARINRGSARMGLGRRFDALEDYFVALQINPLSNAAANAAGNALRELGNGGRAAVAHRRALCVEPGDAEAWMFLGHALRETGGLMRAAQAYGRSYVVNPSKTEAVCYQLFVQQAVCDWRAYDDLSALVMGIIDSDRGLTLPLATLAIGTTPEQQLRSARRFYRGVVHPRPNAAPQRRTKSDPVGRLTIGYFSADFHEHATAYLAAELFELHDRERFRIIAYSFGQDDKSPMRRRLIEGFDVFRDIRSSGLEEIKAMMCADGVDIAVDLKGYTKQTRLDLLAERLAPLHVAYLGYPGTIGSDTMDYIIGDPFVTPPEAQPWFTERLAVLPDSYQINDRRRPLDAPTPSRAECGLPEDAVVFCAFNTTYKLNPMMFDIWMRLLRRVPGSVLWMFEAQAEAKDNLLRAASVRGVDPQRLAFAPKKPLAEHLARYRVADFGVDSFPYTGHTTTSDALWMGMPVVTLLGDTFASSVAAGLLTAAGLPETIARSPQEYEETAVALAADPERLAGYRRRLEENRLKAPLFDSRRFTRHIERAYEIMWGRHAAGEPPQGFLVPAEPV
jgi:protein O-GlcNAc transferase